MKFDDRLKQWFEVDEKEVKKKTSQTLREGAPQWRKANGEWKRRNEEMMALDAGGQQSLIPRGQFESEGPYSDVVRSDPKTRNYPFKKTRILSPPASHTTNNAADGSSNDQRTGLDLLTDAIFNLQKDKKKEKQVSPTPAIPPMQPPVTGITRPPTILNQPPPPLDPAAEALRKWREDNKHVLDRTC